MRKITEEWARNAEAGRDLDTVCAKWHGLNKPRTSYMPSRSWYYAGLLLDILKADLIWDVDMWWCSVEHDAIPAMEGMPPEAGGWTVVSAKDPRLAIARLCAVLLAHGIKGEDLLKGRRL